MGSLRKKTFTKPVPDGAERFERKGETFVRWHDSNGNKKTARLIAGNDGAERIAVESRMWLAKYRDGSGIIREISTGCRDKGAAASVLAELEKRAELIRSNVITATEDAIADHSGTPIASHFDGYLINMRSRGLTDGHISEVTRYLKSLADECRFVRLADVTRSRFDRWLADRREQKSGARTLNCYRAAWIAFLNWCVEATRLSVNPLAGVPKVDEKSDRRRQRRAMTEVELNRLLHVARWRPLAEYGRETLTVEPTGKGNRKRSNWKAAPLTFDTLDDAVDRARERLSEKPELITKLERTGRERELIFRTMLTTGLRKKELTSVKLRNLELDSDPPFLTLDAGSEKNRDGYSIPLRADVAADLREWLAERLESRREAEPDSATLNFASAVAQLRGDVASEPGGNGLSADEPLFKVPTSLLRVLDRDLNAAGIPKQDDRGRTLDVHVHALRHTFGTHLSMAGVPLRTAQAAMRHSSPMLTANVYTDPRLLDVQGAVESLPKLASNRAAKVERATGTDSQLPPMLPPNSGNQRKSESFPVTLATARTQQSGSRDRSKSSGKPTKKAGFPCDEETGLQSGRHDLNVRPPAPKAGALAKLSYAPMTFSGAQPRSLKPFSG